MRSRRSFVVLAALCVTFGCAQGTVVGPSPGGGGAGGFTGIGQTGNGGSTTSFTLPPGSDATVQADVETVKLKVECDGGPDCTCPPFNVAVMGKPGKWGSVRNGDPPTALMDWLNSSSAGTARTDNFTDRTTLTPDFLATYHVMVLASLSEDSDNGPWWTFSADEIAAFRAWVENGGGVISLTGYSSGNEQAPSTQLLGFSGIQYNQDRVGSCIDWQICGCTHSSTLTDWVRTDPVIASLSTGVTMVGFEGGHSITAPADAHVAANVAGIPVLVGKLIGKGRVLAFGDEWITYTSQWNGVGNPSTTDPNCKGFLPQDKYQIAQFWYNMIRWSQPAAECFTIVDSANPITIW
jgi:hypothetical protein